MARRHSAPAHTHRLGAARALRGVVLYPFLSFSPSRTLDGSAPLGLGSALGGSGRRGGSEASEARATVWLNEH